ncbi:MFS transporter [Photobacterium sp. SDRW27]|uniref:MFS transporter n=1 Tax=Photobacterium obscurum TaxID=2829490 RepID=UPI00224353D8|nr:MFS transporter [Photobacterium obscurum]MCW8327619.1 MFS transporter [Photobacterium obscurum]
MTRRTELILLVSLAMVPFGITSAIYNASSAEMAGSLGLSADEASWLNILYIFAQLAMLPLASWLSYRIGAVRLLISGAVIGLASTLISSFTITEAAHFLAWFGHGLTASMMLVAAQVLVLRNLSARDIAYAEGCMLLMTTLLPFGVYPWILAELAESSLWQFSFAVQIIFYLVLLAWFWLRPIPYEDEKQMVKFNLIQAGLITAAIAGVVFILMRGQFYNWFDSPVIIEACLITGGLLMYTVAAMQKQWGQGEYLRSDVLGSRKNIVSMYNGALAGFAVLGTSMLISSYLAGVLKYSHSELGWIQIPAFGSMLLGLAVSIWICNHPRLKPDAVIPIGVLMILISSAFLSGSNTYSGQSDMWPALILRGFGVGVLNVTVTIYILSSFDKKHLPQGISWFYLFRTFGGLAGVALFSRLMSLEASSVINVLGENVNATSTTFIHYQNTLAQLLQNGMLEPTPARVATLLGKQLQTQTSAIVGINNFQWFIIAIGVLAPILIIGKKWAGRANSKE